jgi:hypothetical protein
VAYHAEDLHPLWTVLRFTWADVRETYRPVNPEVFLNPADWDELGKPGTYNGARVCRSIGIPCGTVRIFCRQTLHYLPPTGPRWLDAGTQAGHSEVQSCVPGLSSPCRSEDGTRCGRP